MKKMRFSTLVAIIMGVATLAAAVGAVVYKLEKKRKDDEELDKYIDCCIE